MDAAAITIMLMQINVMIFPLFSRRAFLEVCVNAFSLASTVLTPFRALVFIPNTRVYAYLVFEVDASPYLLLFNVCYFTISGTFYFHRVNRLVT